MARARSPKASRDDSEFAHAQAWRRHRLLVRAGQALLVVGALVGIIHWLTHLEIFSTTQPPGWLDLAAGYPMAAFLLVLGAVLAGRKKPA